MTTACHLKVDSEAAISKVFGEKMKKIRFLSNFLHVLFIYKCQMNVKLKNRRPEIC